MDQHDDSNGAGQRDPWTVWLMDPRDHDAVPPREPRRIGMGLAVGLALAGFWGSAATVAWRAVA